jgi:hypothetical protein
LNYQTKYRISMDFTDLSPSKNRENYWCTNSFVWSMGWFLTEHLQDTTALASKSIKYRVLYRKIRLKGSLRFQQMSETIFRSR